MGGGRDKRKKAKPKEPGAGAIKTARKTEKNETKQQQRAARKAQGGEDDIDAVLAAFKLEESAVKKIEIEKDCAPPSARSCACFAAHVTQRDKQLILFGGECFDGKADKTYVFGDLYVYSCGKNRWTKVTAPNRPTPRSSAQAAVHRKFLYVFGGEVCSPSGQNFKHHRDLWRMDLSSYQWELLTARAGPSARSGHRMVAYKNKLLLFGGFYETASGTARYFNDLWEYDMEEGEWEAVGKEGVAPRPRGGCQMVVHGDTLFLFGGHSVEVAADKSEKETVFNDLWSLHLDTYQWERLKMAGMAPGPRASFNMVAHKARAILFGGITDQPGKGDRLFSQAHDDLFQLNFEQLRWTPLALRPPKKAQKGSVAAAAPAAGQPTANCSADAAAAPDHAGGAAATEQQAAQPPGEAGGAAEGPDRAGRTDLVAFVERGNLGPDSALHRAAVRIQSRYRGYIIRKAYQTYKLGGKLSEMLYSPAAFGVDLSSQHMPRPRARSNAMMTVAGDTLYLFGGVVEIALDDVTLDDLWSLDLKRLEGWQCLRENTAGEDAFKDDDWESASDDAAAAASDDED